MTHDFDGVIYPNTKITCGDTRNRQALCDISLWKANSEIYKAILRQAFVENSKIILNTMVLEGQTEKGSSSRDTHLSIRFKILTGLYFPLFAPAYTSKPSRHLDSNTTLCMSCPGPIINLPCFTHSFPTGSRSQTVIKSATKVNTSRSAKYLPLQTECAPPNGVECNMSARNFLASFSSATKNRLGSSVAGFFHSRGSICIVRSYH